MREAPDHIAKGNRTTSRGRRANAATATLAELGETIEGARIRAITGHEIDTIDEVLKCYAATTAYQAAAALNIRMAYELKDASA
jgi:hypothetical protein